MAMGIDVIFAPLALKHSSTEWIAVPKAEPMFVCSQVTFFANSSREGTCRISTGVVI
jgi:hypothetical protein